MRKVLPTVPHQHNDLCENTSLERPLGVALRSLNLSIIVLVISICSIFPVSARAQKQVAEANSALVKVPNQLQVERRGNSTWVALMDFRPLKLAVSPNMVRGTRWEMNIRQRGNLISRGGGMVSAFKVEPFADVLTRGRDNVPAGKDEYTFEYTITFFETDEPTEHMWSPASGNAYKVLWTHTFKEVVK